MLAEIIYREPALSFFNTATQGHPSPGGEGPGMRSHPYFCGMGTKAGTSFLILFQAGLMLLAGWLISKISFVGRVGINLMYKEYSIFKSWWKTALLLFAIQMVLLLLQNVVHKKYSRAVANIASIVLLITALAGLIATYSDFNNTFSHRILKERFHLGFYLFWLGWMATCLYYILIHRRTNITSVQAVKN